MATTPFSWNPYAAPQVNMGLSTEQTQGFFRPADSKMMANGALFSYLTNGGNATPDMITNRTVKFDGGLTREQIANSTGFLDGQLKTGFEGLSNTLDSFGSLGGLGGMSGASPVYRPNGGAVGQGASNGQPLPWGVSNPFNQTF